MKNSNNVINLDSYRDKGLATNDNQELELEKIHDIQVLAKSAIDSILDIKRLMEELNINSKNADSLNITKKMMGEFLTTMQYIEIAKKESYKTQASKQKKTEDEQ